jgi:hypothetical protein
VPTAELAAAELATAVPATDSETACEFDALFELAVDNRSDAFADAEFTALSELL